MPTTLRLEDVNDDHMGFTSAVQNADGTYTLYYGDEPPAVVAVAPVQEPAARDAPPSLMKRMVNVVLRRKG